MKVVVLASDESILVPGSAAHARMAKLSALFDELHIIVACRAAHSEASLARLHTYPARGGLAWVRILRVWRRAVDVCRRVAPDVLSSETADLLGLVGHLLSRRFGIPLQVQVHTDIMSRHYRAASWKERLRYRIARFVLPRAAGVRAVSPRVSAGIIRELRIPPARVCVLPIRTNAGGLSSTKDSSRDDDRFSGFDLRLISAGRFVEREKNFRLLIDAMAEVVRDRPRALLVLAGEGPDRGRLERRIRERCLEGHVWIEGWRDDLPDFLKGFDLFLLSSNFEGWPRVCGEAIAAGLPVITTDVGLAGDLLVDGVSAIVVPVGDALAMARAILGLSRDVGRRRALAQAARQAVERLPFLREEEYSRRYLAALQGCLRP